MTALGRGQSNFLAAPIVCAGLGTAALASLLSSASNWTGPSAFVRWTLLTLAVILGSWALEAATAGVDLTRPSWWVNGVFLILFVLHPVLRADAVGVDAPFHLIYAIAPTYATAARLAFVGVLTTNIAIVLTAYAAARDRDKRFADARPPVVDGLACKTIGLLCLIPLALDLLGVLSIGDSGAEGSGVAPTSAYVYLLPFVAVPGACLLIVYGKLSRSVLWTLVGVIAALTFTASLMLAGQRAYAIGAFCSPCMLLLIIYAVKIPRIILLVGGAAALFLLSVVRDVGPGGSFTEVLNFSMQNPGYTLQQSFIDDDTEMLDALSLEVQAVPDVIPYRPGEIVFSTLAAPIPRQLWPNKPVSADITLNTYFLSRGINQASVAYSMFGEAYFSGGLIAIGIVGTALGACYGYFTALRTSRSSVAQLVYCIVVPFAIVLIRGIVAYSAAYLFFYLTPIVVVMLWSRFAVAWRLRFDPGSFEMSPSATPATHHPFNGPGGDR